MPVQRSDNPVGTINGLAINAQQINYGSAGLFNGFVGGHSTGASLAKHATVGGLSAHSSSGTVESH